MEHKAEQYPEAIRSQMEQAETEFAQYVQVRLGYIYNKTLEYAKKRMLTAKSLKDMKGFFRLADFAIDLKLLNKVVQIGIDEQSSKLSDYIGGDVNELSGSVGFKLASSVEDVSYQAMIADRQAFLSDVLMDNTLTIANGVIEEGLRIGQNQADIATQLSTSLGMDSVRADKIARTESNYLLNGSQETYLKNLGVESYKVQLAEDACDQCVSETNDGKKTFTTSPLPFHPNCRCILIADYENSGSQVGTLLSLLGLVSYLKNKNQQTEQIQKSLKENIDRLDKRISDLKLKKGEKGEKPIKGKDYYTEDEIEELKKAITPIKGKDYFDGKSSKEIDMAKVQKSLQDLYAKHNEGQLGIDDKELQAKIEKVIGNIQIISPKPQWGQVYGDITKQTDLMNYLRSAAIAANATATPTAAKIPIADSNGKVNGWVNRTIPNVTVITSNANPTFNTDTADALSITALAINIASMTLNMTGTPVNFQKLIVRILDDGTPRTIAWGAKFVARGVALPTLTVASKLLTVGFIYNTVTNTWGCVASAQEA